MRSLHLLAGLVLLACGAPRVEPVDGGELPDSGAADSGAPDPDAGAQAEDAGQVHFEKVATLPMRARALWADGPSIWVVGDANAMYTFDARGWLNASPPGGSGINWLEIRGQGANVWAVGERPDAGSYLYRSATHDVRRIEDEGVSIQVPHLLAAHPLDGIWVGGSDEGAGAILATVDFGEQWFGFELPQCAPIVGGWAYPFRVDGVVRQSIPEAILADSTMVVPDIHDNMLSFVLTSRIAEQTVAGPAAVFMHDEAIEVVIVGEQSLLEWHAETAIGATTPLIVDGFKPTAVWGASLTDTWAVGDDQVVYRDGSLTWSRLRVPGEQLVAVHGGNATNLWLVSADGDVFRRAR